MRHGQPAVVGYEDVDDQLNHANEIVSRRPTWPHTDVMRTGTHDDDEPDQECKLGVLQPTSPTPRCRSATGTCNTRSRVALLSTFHHIRLRTTVARLRNCLAWVERPSVLSTRSSIRSPRLRTASMLRVMIDLTLSSSAWASRIGSRGGLSMNCC